MRAAIKIPPSHASTTTSCIQPRCRAQQLSVPTQQQCDCRTVRWSYHLLQKVNVRYGAPWQRRCGILRPRNHGSSSSHIMRSCSLPQKSSGGLNLLHTGDSAARPLKAVACRSSISDPALQKRIMATLDKQLEQRPSISVSLDDYRIVGNIDTSRVPESLKKDCILFYTPETEPLARKVAEEGSHVQLGKIRWKCFPDGFPDLFVHSAMDIRNRHVGFLASFHDPGRIFEQISIIYALPRLFIGSFTLVLPFFPTGTAERVETEGDVATAFTLARILSNIPPSRGGPTSIVIFDIHALQERFYFGDGVLPLFESGIPLLLERLKQLPDQGKVTIAYPDEGAWKRFHYQFKDEGYPEVICTKVRDGAKRIVRLKEGEPQGRHVVIVDDLVQSGGTLIECHALLSSLGAKHVSAYVTHGVFPKESWKKFKADNGEGAAANGGFRYFWLTDSCPQTAANVEQRKPFEVLTLAGPIAEALQI